MSLLHDSGAIGYDRLALSAQPQKSRREDMTEADLTHFATLAFEQFNQASRFDAGAFLTGARSTTEVIRTAVARAMKHERIPVNPIELQELFKKLFGVMLSSHGRLD